MEFRLDFTEGTHPMRGIKEAGITARELDQLVDDECWQRWCRTERELATFDSLRTVRDLRGRAEDVALGALLRLAAQDGGDDRLAAVAVLHQLGGAARLMMRSFWSAAAGEAEAIVVGAMWEQIRTYDWQTHTTHHGSVLVHATRRSLRSALWHDDPKRQSSQAVPTDPHSALFDAPFGDAPLRVSVLGAADQLEVLLRWSLREGALADDEAALLEALVDSDRQNPAIPRWMRGACSMAAVQQAAAQRGLCARSVTRARDRAIAKLRRAAPTFWEEVA